MEALGDGCQPTVLMLVQSELLRLMEKRSFKYTTCEPWPEVRAMVS